jgi:tetratricopeptide (TPR) repeat protein
LRHDRRLDARSRQVRRAAPALVAFVTFLAFLPSLRDGFVAWDDDKNFLGNPHYRGLGAAQLHWMWTTFHLGHYVPLTWMTLGLDYTLWGMNPAGYHLTSLLIHCANAVLVYFVARRLLARAFEGIEMPALVAGSAIAALLFAIHPLRVESVTWITERRDVLSGFFYLSSLLCYLRAVEGESAARGSYIAAVVLFACALLSKATALTLPATLLVLNVYPLRRVDGFNRSLRRVLVELLPFGVLAAAAAVLSIVALHPPAQLGPAQKIAVSAYGLAFYIWKTILPASLSPLYELPQHVDPFGVRYGASYIGVIVLVAAVWAIHRRWPGVAAAMVAFFVAILPMLGVVQNGPQLTADRYTYFAAPALAILAGGIFVWLTQRAEWRAVARAVAVVVLLLLATLTWRQSEVWHDSSSLWTRVLELDDNSSIAHVGMATLLLRDNQIADASVHARRAVDIAPGYAQAHNDLGVALARSGALDDAIREYERSIALEASYDEPHSNLGMALAARGDLNGAIEQYRAALALNPDAADAQVNWGNSLVRGGSLGDAIPHYEAALAIRPDDADAELNWGVALALERKYREAADHFRAALRIDPNQREAQVYLERAEGLMR